MLSTGWWARWRRDLERAADGAGRYLVFGLALVIPLQLPYFFLSFHRDFTSLPTIGDPNFLSLIILFLSGLFLLFFWLSSAWLNTSIILRRTPLVFLSVLLILGVLASIFFGLSPNRFIFSSSASFSFSLPFIIGLISVIFGATQFFGSGKDALNFNALFWSSLIFASLLSSLPFFNFDKFLTVAEFVSPITAGAGLVWLLLKHKTRLDWVISGALILNGAVGWFIFGKSMIGLLVFAVCLAVGVVGLAFSGSSFNRKILPIPLFLALLIFGFLLVEQREIFSNPELRRDTAIVTRAWLSTPKSFVMGFGGGSYPLVYSSFYQPEESLGFSGRPPSPVSTFLSLINDFGVLGGLLALGVSLVGLSSLVAITRSLRRPEIRNSASLKPITEQDLRYFAPVSAGFFGLFVYLLFSPPTLLAVVGLAFLLVTMVLLAAEAHRAFLKEKTFSLISSPALELFFGVVYFGFFGVLGFFSYHTKQFVQAETSIRLAYLFEGESRRDTLASAIKSYPFSEYHHRLYVRFAVDEAEKSRRIGDFEKLGETMLNVSPYIKSLLELDPNDARAHALSGSAYLLAHPMVSGTLPWAEAAFTEAVRLEPSSYEFFWQKGQAEFFLGKDEAALESFLTARKLNPFFLPATTGLSAIFERQGDLSAAIAVYAPLSLQIVGNAEAMFNLARLAYNRGQEGDREKAKNIWLEILSFDNKHKNSLLSLAIFYEKEKQPREAEKYYKILVELEPDNQEFQKKAGLVR